MSTRAHAQPEQAVSAARVSHGASPVAAAALVAGIVYVSAEAIFRYSFTHSPSFNTWSGRTGGDLSKRPCAQAAVALFELSPGGVERDLLCERLAAWHREARSAEQHRGPDRLGVHDVTEAYRAAGIWMEPFPNTNRDKIASLSDWFAASCVLLAAEVILWTVSLAS